MIPWLAGVLVAVVSISVVLLAMRSGRPRPVDPDVVPVETAGDRSFLKSLELYGRH